MIPFWVALLIIIILFILGLLYEIEKREDVGFSFFILGIPLIFVAHSIFTDVSVSVPSHIDEIPIYSLRMEDGLEGSFSLGFGKIGNTSKYYAYTGDSENGYILIALNAEETFLLPSSEVINGMNIK